MGLIEKVFGVGGKKARKITAADLFGMLVGSESNAGVTVTVDSAMRLATVWACVRLLAESIAQLPCHVYVKNRDGSKSRVTDTRLAEMLAYRPNNWQTPFEYTEFAINSLGMRGNHYAYIERDGKGDLDQLLPFAASSVTVKRKGFGELKYQVSFADGHTEDFDQQEITHVRGLTFDGVVGVSPLTHHRETIGLTDAAASYGGRLFKNGARPSGVIRVPSTLSEDAYNRLRDNWEKNYGGGNVGKTALLEEGSEYQAMSMSNGDAQYLELRQFQRTEICSIFRIPPHMVGDLTKSSFSNITQQSLEFVKYTILPWCVRMEQAMHRDLLSADERRKGMFVEFVVAGLERADIQTRYTAYKEGILGGWLNPNEVRRKENMNPRPGGDTYLTPLNMIESGKGPAGDAGKGIKPMQYKGVMARERLRSTFRDRFRKLAAQVVRYEATAIRELLSADADLLVGIDEFYSQFPGRFETTFRGLMREYAMSVKGAAVSEAGATSADVDTTGFGNFIDELLAGMAARHAYSSSGQLRNILLDDTVEDVLAALEERLTEWEESRAAKIAERETVQQESAVSRYVWAAVGVTLLQWVNRGSKSCPFCESLNGKVVGVETPFIGEGNYEPEGYENSPWKVRGPKMHPQLHQGCQCAIIPVIGE